MPQHIAAMGGRAHAHHHSVYVVAPSAVDVRRPHAFVSMKSRHREDRVSEAGADAASQ